METHINLRSSPERLLISAPFQYPVKHLILSSRRCKRYFPIAAILGMVPCSITAKSPAICPSDMSISQPNPGAFIRHFFDWNRSQGSAKWFMEWRVRVKCVLSRNHEKICLPTANGIPSNRKWQDYVYIQCEYKSTKQKIKHLLREENKVKENKIS